MPTLKIKLQQLQVLSIHLNVFKSNLFKYPLIVFKKKFKKQNPKLFKNYDIVNIYPV